MIGMMIGRAVLRGTAQAASKGAADPKDVKPTEAGGVVVGMVLVGLAVIVIASIANGGQVVAWITPVAVLMGLLILGGMFASGASKATVKIAKIKDIPGNPNEVPSAAELNAYYETLRNKPERTEPVLGVQNVTAAPQPRQYVSLRTILDEEVAIDAEIRHNRVSDILKAGCPVCTTHAGGFCTFHPGQRVVKLDEGIIIHSERLSAAIKTGVAKLEDVKAQFKGTIPADIMADAL